MLREVLLPQLGQTMEEGTVERWHKNEGDHVKKGEVLYEITTDKATLEVESFAEGVLKVILVQAGQTVPVNELVAIIGAEDDELPEDLESYRAAVSPGAVAGGESPAAAGPSVAAPVAIPAVAPAAAPAVPERAFASPRARKLAREQTVPVEVLSGTGPNGRIVERDVTGYLEGLSALRFTPAARKLAFDLRVDLRQVAPSGTSGRIAKEDVEAAAAARAAAPRPGQAMEMTAMRRTIASRMTQSKQTIPHFYLIGDINMRRAMAYRKELNAAGDVHITVTDLLVRAAALALKQCPRMNATFAGDRIVLNARVNVGVAVSVADGLFVPVVKDADAKALAQVSAELKALAQTAREGKLLPDQYEGGSLTISNLGTFGVDYFLPIINPPESCILGIGRVAEQLVVQDGAIRIEPMMKISLSADHRVTDGAAAAGFFQAFRDILMEPEQL